MTGTDPDVLIARPRVVGDDPVLLAMIELRAVH